MHVIIICMYEKGGMKNNREKVATSFKTLKGRKLCGPGSDLAEFRTHPSSFNFGMKRIRLKKAENVATPFFPITSLWGFFPTLRAANSAVNSQIVQNFTLLRALMYAIFTCKYEKDRM